MKDIRIVIPSYNGVQRLAHLLGSVEEHDIDVFNHVKISVFEDPSTPEVAKRYDFIERIFPKVAVYHLDTWSNMHGAAQKAFRYESEADWIIYLGDDVLVTPKALSNMVHFIDRNDLDTVALIQFPYWNAHDLCENHGGAREYQGPALLRTKEDMYTRDFEWLKQVPRNPHWDGDGFARPYVNVNGVGFAARRAAWEAVGGFAEGTWCLDESLSVRVWTRSEWGIVCLPGPPLVHFFGGATTSNPPAHDLHTEEAWIRGMKMTKKEAGELSYEIMFRREAKINEEMKRAHYYC